MNRRQFFGTAAATAFALNLSGLDQVVQAASTSPEQRAIIKAQMTLDALPKAEANLREYYPVLKKAVSIASEGATVVDDNKPMDEGDALFCAPAANDPLRVNAHDVATIMMIETKAGLPFKTDSGQLINTKTNLLQIYPGTYLGNFASYAKVFEPDIRAENRVLADRMKTLFPAIIAPNAVAPSAAPHVLQLRPELLLSATFVVRRVEEGLPKLFEVAQRCGIDLSRFGPGVIWCIHNLGDGAAQRLIEHPDTPAKKLLQADWLASRNIAADTPGLKAFAQLATMFTLVHQGIKPVIESCEQAAKSAPTNQLSQAFRPGEGGTQSAPGRGLHAQVSRRVLLGLT